MTRTPAPPQKRDDRPSRPESPRPPGTRPIKIYKAGENAGGDSRSTAAATPR